MAIVPPRAGDTLAAAARKILQQPEPGLKAEWTQQAAELWRSGGISDTHADGEPLPPATPGRSSKVKLVQPWEVPKIGRGGTPASRIAMTHSLCHIEGVAVDLAWDNIARFVPQVALPRAFCDDFVAVAEDEARHFTLLEARLRELGSEYGALPAHEGLWESAAATAHSLPARLAIESCVHEARGLDVLPQTISRFRNGGDKATAQLLEDVIYPEEISHCAAGTRWLTYLFDQAKGHDTANALECDALAPQMYPDVHSWFHALVRQHFKGDLKPPFNESARTAAGFSAQWWQPLVATGRQQNHVEKPVE
jgi:uncharacterized ferritin-like protein (DUF455 family)